jgi:predicted Zn-dependent peptidase
VLDAELDRLGVEPVSTAELAGARARLERLDAEAVSTSRGLAESLALTAVYYGDASVVNRTSTAFAGITPEHLRSVANLYLVDTSRTIVVVRPGGEEP